MAGWRIGFCCGNADMIKALGTIKGYYDYGIFQAVQIAAILAMREGDQFVEAQAKIYQERRDVMVRGLRRMGWEVAGDNGPAATMFVWAKVNPEHLARYEGSTNKMCMALVEEAEVAMTPGAAFGPLGEGYVRMALVENEQRIRQALRQVSRVLSNSAEM
jgi:alanine-synthesizing transaminase